MKSKYANNQLLYNLIVVFLMIVVGGGIRFCNLTLKTIWADEVASIVHALGNSFDGIQVNRVINLNDLLQPLKYNAQHNVLDVIKYGFFEDFVPPFHFILLHLWILIFEKSNEVISLFTARSLSVVLSTLSIAAIYFLSKTLFKDSQKVWLIAALFTTISPYSIALSQEARHYSSSMVCVIISILIFFQVSKLIIHNHTLSKQKIGVLAVINFIGIASHYFFVLVIISELMTLIVITIQYKLKPFTLNIYVVMLSNIAVMLMWLPVYFLNNSRDELTAWAYIDLSRIEVFAHLLLQPLISSITMFFLLPVESSNKIIVAISAITMIGAIFLASCLIYTGIKASVNTGYDLPIRFLILYLLISIIELILISCLFKKDFLASPRYHFIYFPALIILVSYFVCKSFDHNRYFVLFECFFVSKKIMLNIFILIIFASSLCVISNLSFLKPHSPDMMFKTINNVRSDAKLIATTKTINNISSIIALGWHFYAVNSHSADTNFFIAKLQNNATKQDLIDLAHPRTSLWMINYQGDVALNSCWLRESSAERPIHGYEYRHYQCLELDHVK